MVHGGLQPTAALPGCLPRVLLWRGLWGAWWGWAGLAAWPGVTEHSSWGRDKSQGQRQVPGLASPKAEPECKRYLRESCGSWAVPQCAWIVSGCAVTTEPIQEPPPVKC